MTTQPRPKSRFKKLLVRLATRVLILLVAYVLSIGPMYWKWEDAMMTGDNDTLLIFYMPLMVASELSETFRTLINGYIELWVYA
ncbi:hypothetical protein Mal52_21000 [Symmachiella dynata]|uniref:Uncharacterized protein n=1 Tax=Symmachiella dynata TaxID=2527995 RepID=A0A517ZMB6_9PLAN|nr:hypothetical protein [Symmachiella dynata]QDU43624.1 hypothetical protein Mal52_21000 [Symmachiella dynata]